MIIYFLVILFLLIGSSYKSSNLIYNLYGDINGYGYKEDGRFRTILFGALPLFLVLGLKSADVGVDMVSYVYRYENAKEMMTSSVTSSEMGFNLFNLFLSKIGVPWQMYLSICAFILMAGWMSFIRKYSTDSYYSFFIYVTIGLFTMNLSGIRQSLALAMCLMAMVIYENMYSTKKKKAFILFELIALLAATFHNSAIIFSVVPFFMRFRFTKRQCLMLLLFASAAILYKDIVTSFLPSFEGTRYEEFTFDEEYGINVLVVLFTITVPLVSLIFIQPEADNRLSKKITAMFIFASINVFFTMLSINNNQLGRVGYYFQPCYLILLPCAINSIKSEEKPMVKFVTTVVCLTYFILGTMGGTLKIDNYTFFWQQ